MANITILNKERLWLKAQILEKYPEEIKETGYLVQYEDLEMAVKTELQILFKDKKSKKIPAIGTAQLRKLFINAEELGYNSDAIDACYYYISEKPRSDFRKQNPELRDSWENSISENLVENVAEDAVITPLSSQLLSENDKNIATTVVPSAPAKPNSKSPVTNFVFVAMGVLFSILSVWAYRYFYPPQVVWYMTTSWDTNTTTTEILDRFIRKIRKDSHGRFRIIMLTNNKLPDSLSVNNKPSDVYNVLSQPNSAIQMFHTSGYYLENPAFMFFSSLPFGMGEEDMRKWIGDENWQKSDTLTQAYKYWCALHEPKGVIPFPFGCSDAQWGGWYKREPKNIQDFKNWKIRCGGGAARILMEHLGAKWSKIPQHDILSAMASDTLDWVEWISAGEDTKMGLHFLGDKYHLHDESWHEPFSMLELLVNKTAFDALDTELKSCFYISLNWVQAESANLVKLGNERAREKHISGNTKIKTFKFKQELREDLRKETLHVLDSVIAADSIKNPIIKDIYKSYKKNCTNCELFR